MGLFSKKEDKYITRVMGFHNPSKGVVYRKIKVKKKTLYIIQHQKIENIWQDNNG